QVSLVQTFPSSQLGGGPPMQVPPAQVSLVVQALLSEQGLALLACRQPSALSQVSLVQTFPSSRSGEGPAVQGRPAELSMWRQALLAEQGLVLLACRQLSALSQVSLVQTFPSSQLGGGPPMQVPPAQVSLVVQALLSEQGLVLLACRQPSALSQESLVQTFPSS